MYLQSFRHLFFQLIYYFKFYQFVIGYLTAPVVGKQNKNPHLINIAFIYFSEDRFFYIKLQLSK